MLAGHADTAGKIDGESGGIIEPHRLQCASMLHQPAQIAERGDLGREKAVRDCGIMRGGDRRDRALPRRVEMVPNGRELRRMLARIHVIIDIDRFETAWSLCSLDGLVEMEKAMIATVS